MQTILEQINSRLSRDGGARRLFHGRGRCFPGYEDLVIDWYSPVVLVMLYRVREERWLRLLVGQLKAALPDLAAVVLQERHLPGAPSRLLFGSLPDEVDALEDGLRYRLRLMNAQNIGFFPDMKEGRGFVRHGAAGAKVLNLFAYSCSFSVAALAGGARSVVNVDMSRSALELGRLNHLING